MQEVIYGAGEPIQPTEYTGNGDVHEFRYGKDLARMFNNERLAYLKNFGESWGYLSSAKAVVFTDNHDTQREGGVLTYRNRGTYALANAFMLAWPYGTPAVMSSSPTAAGTRARPPTAATGSPTSPATRAGSASTAGRSSPTWSASATPPRAPGSPTGTTTATSTSRSAVPARAT
ncbi:hypothetical protein V2I01_03890 [Micromonospora sp. BRA006-A]|nr:hypothetical protein [Micromonospora sp. BRA006-A]